MFYFQDGRFSKSLTTHEAILTAAINTQNNNNYGAGVFAFATSSGAALLFEDRVFSSFLSNNDFTLIVGIDDITNTQTLVKLGELRDRYQPHLKVKVFCHNDSESLFHPKFIWFKIDDEVRLLTGSGNLTEKGLRRNREAFTVSNLKNNELSDFESDWNLWISENDNNLLDLEHEEVVRKAAQNATRFFRTRNVETELEVEEENYTEVLETSYIIPENIETEDYGAWSIEGNPEVLIAEIPSSNNRWKQANFSRAVFEGFFGGMAGVNEERRILLRCVDSNGNLERLEVRPMVSVISRNFRVELNAASGLNYPEGVDRPIGVFVKVSTRSFLYSLVMPGDVEYNEVLSLLNRFQPRGRKMRRYLTDVEMLKENCPNLGFWIV